MILFQVSTHFQLICALIVRMQMVPDEEADLHLDDMTDFSGIIGNLTKLGLFRHIECSTQAARAIELNGEYKKTRILLTAPIPDIWGFEHECDYTDIYFGHDMNPNKMYYYHLLERGCKPRIHILDEGMTAYYKDIVAATGKDFLDHDSFGDDKYLLNITEQMLFNPDIYCLENVNWQVTKVPSVNEECRKIILEVYGNPTFDFPSEPYVYLASGGYEQNFFSNEIDMINLLAQCVGKENIIVKQHPRYMLNPYEKFGFKVWGGSGSLPWELLLLLHDTSDQIFVTFFSNAAISPHNILGKEQIVVFLYYLFQGTTRHGLFGSDVEASFRYLKKLVHSLNAERKLVYVADSQAGAKEIFRYLEGKRRGGSLHG